MADYVTLAEFKNNSELIGYAFADYDAQLAISAASNGIEQYCGRRFNLDTSGTNVRYYSVTEPRELNIDDIVCTSYGATVQVDVDGDGVFETTWVRNTDFFLEPLNAQADGWPYETIRVSPRSAQRFPSWPRSVQVTGQFGWPAVPQNVKEATMIMSVRLMKRAREAPFGVAAIGFDGAAVRVARVDPDVAFLLDNWVRGYQVLVG